MATPAVPDDVAARPPWIVRVSQESLDNHGNHVHGYPPEHTLHDSVLSMTGRRASDAYAHTMQSMQRFADYGYEVRYVWAHEFHAFAMCARAARRPCEQLLSIVHEL